MFRRHNVLLFVLIIAVVLFAGANAERRAWQQGYAAGQISVVQSDGAVVAAPVAPGVGGYAGRLTGIWPVLLIVGGLALVMGVVRCACWTAWCHRAPDSKAYRRDPRFDRRYHGCGPRGHRFPRHQPPFSPWWGPCRPEDAPEVDDDDAPLNDDDQA